jgi:hypothetical protein
MTRILEAGCNKELLFVAVRCFLRLIGLHYLQSVKEQAEPVKRMQMFRSIK